MTTITYIALNAALGTSVVVGLLRLLAHGIASGRHAVEAELRELPARESDSLAA
jgi:hypothetical protein